MSRHGSQSLKSFEHEVQDELTILSVQGGLYVDTWKRNRRNLALNLTKQDDISPVGVAEEGRERTLCALQDLVAKGTFTAKNITTCS